jgi:hypothetical protein
VMSETLQSLATEVMAQVPPSYPVNKQWYCASFVIMYMCVWVWIVQCNKNQEQWCTFPCQISYPS